MSTKTCRTCEKPFPATTEHFQKDDTPDGLRASCRSCKRLQDIMSRQRKKLLSGRKTILVLSDVHHPEHDRQVWKTTLELAKDLKPDEVILLGDFLELASCSQHGAVLDKLTEDFMSGIVALREIREAVGEACTITYLEGNHESRLTRFVYAKAPSLAETLSIPLGLKLEELNVEWVPEAKQPVVRGDLDFTHGHQDLRDRPSKYHANRMAEIYGRPGRTVVYGHTHKPQAFTRPAVGGVASAVGLGCARTLMPGWLHGAQAGWVHQIAVVYLTPAGKGYVYPINFHHGQAVWDGKLYGVRE